MEVMTWRVTVTYRAELQLYNATLWWAENRSTEQAIRWLDGFQEAIRQLAENADRWPPAPNAIIFHSTHDNLCTGWAARKLTARFSRFAATKFSSI